MKSNRRGFLQKAGLLASTSGLSYALPSDVFSETLPREQKSMVKASVNIALAETSSGKIRGYIHNDIFNFKGIPYGAPTGGENRFMPPKKVDPWNGVRDCLVYGPVSPQKINSGWLQQEYGFLYQWIDGFQDEDCLRLNIWTSGLNDGKKRPVMFWIHGGGFSTGSSQEHPSYDGENLSKSGEVVMVSVNHRLNAFGYLDLADYGSRYASSGNVGMLDIVAALEWVRDNIENFGGDKDNVTIFGQSGGGTKVITLMAMPSAKGLFHKAISQSNSIVQVATHEYATQITSHVLAELEISRERIEEIQKIKPTRLLEALSVAEQKMGSAVPANVGRSGLQPVVEGHILPAHPFDPVGPALSANVPFMVGSTRNEASASINNAAIENIDEEGLKKKIADRFGSKGDRIYQVLRKVHPEVKPVEVLSFISAQNPIAYLQALRKSVKNSAPVYQYLFAWHTPVLDGRPRSFHCSEIPFALGNTDRCENYTGTSEEARR